MQTFAVSASKPFVGERVTSSGASRACRRKWRAAMVEESPKLHDLTQTLGSFMDRHLLVPLLDFLKERGLYEAAELDEAKLQLLFGTNMVDAAVDIYQELHSTTKVPNEYAQRREEVSRSPSAGCRQSPGAPPPPLRAHPSLMCAGVGHHERAARGGAAHSRDR